MGIRTYTAFLVLGLAFALLSSVAQAAPAACDHKGCTWLATGTVTRIDGTTLYLLGKDNVIYTIDAGSADVIYDSFAAGCDSLVVGSTVRVYGTITDPKTIKASRVRVCPAEKPATTGSGPAPKQEIKIIVEPEPVPQAVPAQPGMGAQPANWFGRGLVTDIDYTARRMRITNSTGTYTINVGSAVLASGTRAIQLASLGQGDAVRVTGRLVGLNEIDATEVRVVRTRVDAESAVSQKPISVVGIIQQIDYPSFTFTMSTESTPIVVLADADTHVQQQGKKSAFMQLKPGMRVRMSGTGSLATGFAAREIQIIGIAP